MPNYQYVCPKDHEMERIEPMGLDTHPECPTEGCGAEMRRVFGKVGFSFKGGAPTPNFGERAARVKRYFG